MEHYFSYLKIGLHEDPKINMLVFFTFYESLKYCPYEMQVQICPTHLTANFEQAGSLPALIQKDL